MPGRLRGLLREPGGHLTCWDEWTTRLRVRRPVHVCTACARHACMHRRTCTPAPPAPPHRMRPCTAAGLHAHLSLELALGLLGGPRLSALASHAGQSLPCYVSAAAAQPAAAQPGPLPVSAGTCAGRALIGRAATVRGGGLTYTIDVGTGTRSASSTMCTREPPQGSAAHRRSASSSSTTLSGLAGPPRASGSALGLQPAWVPANGSAAHRQTGSRPACACACTSETTACTSGLTRTQSTAGGSQRHRAAIDRAPSVKERRAEAAERAHELGTAGHRCEQVKNEYLPLLLACCYADDPARGGSRRGSHRQAQYRHRCLPRAFRLANQLTSLPAD